MSQVKKIITSPPAPRFSSDDPQSQITFLRVCLRFSRAQTKQDSLKSIPTIEAHPQGLRNYMLLRVRAARTLEGFLEEVILEAKSRVVSGSQNVPGRKTVRGTVAGSDKG